MNIIKEEVGDLKDVVVRIRKRNLNGNTGQAIRNSGYQLAQNLTMKAGSLLFTIVIARMLLPELMGLYSLSLATIAMFVSFSDLGISAAVMTFVSKMLGTKNHAKAKGYIKKLFKWKLRIITISSLVLVFSSYFVANIYYSKPIFYALLAGGLYLPTISLLGFLEQIFKTINNFKDPLFKEVVFQVSRFVLVPIGILLLLKSNLSKGVIIAIIILIIVFCHLLSLLTLLALSKNKFKVFSLKEKRLNKSEIQDLKKFILPLSVLSLSGVFFGYVDTFMLGHYVSSSFIAYYGAAFALVGSASAIIGFSTAALMPIFSRVSGKSLERIFSKTRNLTLSISLIAGVFTYFVAWWVIELAYGTAYLTAVPILQYLSILVVILPVAGLYNSYFISQKKTKIVAELIVMATIINVIFNFIGINYGLVHYGEIGGVLGAVGATVLSRIVYMGTLIFWKK